MSFKSSNLSVLAYANGFTLWHYATADDSVATAGYFDTASDLLRDNDLIIANVDTDGTPDTVFYTVSASSSSGVTVSTFTA